MARRFSRRGAMGAGGALAAALWGRPLLAGGAARPGRPLVLAHRGASALRPEHTLAAYAKAITDGADFIEPDLVPTKDGVLIVRHEPNITETTDVAARAEFAERRTSKVIDGESQDGWFTTDFTFAELKSLHAKERLGAMRTESAGYDGQFRVVSFDEVLDFVGAESAARGRKIGLIPEIKHSTYFAAQGFAMEKLFADALMASGFARRAPVIVQSFEIANLLALRQLLGEMPGLHLMQLIHDDQPQPADVVAAGGSLTYEEMLTPQGLAGIALYADWVAPQLRRYIPLTPDGKLGEPTTMAGDAHRAGLLAGCYTFRPENRFLAADFKDDQGDDARNPEGSMAEIKRYLAEGLDGFFTDDPALGREVVDAG